jgi:hypothetical protein
VYTSPDVTFDVILRVKPRNKMTEKHPKTPYLCRCTKCVEYPTGPTAELHRQINQLVVLLKEKHRRQLVGLLARQLGQGGVSTMAQVTGLSRTTITRGQHEISASDFSDRIRAKGGGRPLTEKKRPDC